MELIDQFVEIREEFESIERAIDNLRDEAASVVARARGLALTSGCSCVLIAFDDLLSELHGAAESANDEIRKIEEAEEAGYDQNPEGPQG
jgi:hypothetical protein